MMGWDEIKMDLHKEHMSQCSTLDPEGKNIGGLLLHNNLKAHVQRLCTFVLLFWPGSFVECGVLIGCYIRTISNYTKFPQCIQGDNGPLIN